jgi:hypothetical protein
MKEKSGSPKKSEGPAASGLQPNKEEIALTLCVNVRFNVSGDTAAFLGDKNGKNNPAYHGSGAAEVSGQPIH